MHNVSLEESRKHVSAEVPGAIFVYRPHTEFSEFVLDAVEHIQGRGLQRIVILVQKGVEASVVEDATERIAELLESEPSPVHLPGGAEVSDTSAPPGRKIALECFHELTRADLRRIKRKWKRAQKGKVQ